MNDLITKNAAANSDQHRAIAEVQGAMLIARSNPRNAIAAIDRIENACARPALAAVALYSYARGGADVTGPSIRLAEMLAQCWGNISFGVRELEQRDDESTVQAFAWDLECNTRKEVTFQIGHERHTKKGVQKLVDPRDIYELAANNGARRLRACILSIIPGDVVETAVLACEKTLKASADTSPAAMAKLLAAFLELGVTREQIEARIQRRIDAIQPAQVVALRKIWSSLRDGMSVPEDWFGADRTPAPAAPEPSRECPAEHFEKQLTNTWGPAIAAGKAATAVIAQISSKYDLSPEQLAKINSYTPKAEAEGEAQ